MIEKELTKFKSDLQKMKGTPRLNNPQKKTKKGHKKRSILIKLNNAGLIDSLEDVGEKTKDFYETAIDAADQNVRIIDSGSESTYPLVAEKPKPVSTSVRFDNVEVFTYSREPSTMTGDGIEDEYDEEGEDIESLIEDEDEFFGLAPHFKSQKINNNFQNYSEKTVTTTTTTRTTLRYLSNDDGYFHYSPNPPSTTSEEAESTDSSELNFYQMFDLDQKKDVREDGASEEKLSDSLTVKSYHPSATDTKPANTAVESEDLVQEIIRVKAISNVANRHRLLRTYLMKWMHFTTIQKITKDSNLTTKSQRMTKIDAYLKKIREQKKLAKKEDKITVESTGQGKIIGSRDNAIVMVKRYQSKLKLQQDIIEVQKLKLERQERMIAELRLSRLSDDAKKFKQDLREELRNAMRTGDVRLRAKAKCLQVVGDVVEEQETKFVAYGNMIPKFLAKMQERSLERQIRHEQAKDRRMMLEHERDAQKMAIEEEKRQADEEAKRQRMLELQEKRKREKMEKLRKEQEREKFVEDTRKAKAFYRQYLLRRFGLDRLKKLIHRKHVVELKASNLRKRMKTKACFSAWLRYTRLVWTLKFDKARDYYDLYVQRICMRVWRDNLMMARGQLLVAVDWHEMKLNEKFFSNWLAQTREAKLAEEAKMRHAEAHHKWHVLWRMVSTSGKCY